ncbi:MAG: hypothetical protein JSU65_03455 [Candidatus Zixiibacteriota bacterium]|nr:MAG: hypothetical protein JSU65_03455 [candidate division Zixibacteria bacterium]
MSQVETLKILEERLESYLDEAIALKDERLGVLDGLHRLDIITRGFIEGDSLTDDIGNWFGDHSGWLESDRIKAPDRNRVNLMLGQIQKEIHASQDDSPAARKISGEINRWSERLGQAEKADEKKHKLVLKRQPESAAGDLEDDTIPAFAESLQRTTGLFLDLSGDRQHLMSVLDEALKSATLGQSKEALLLSASIIYYLKRNGYKVEPFLKRLKEAESVHQGGSQRA